MVAFLHPIPVLHRHSTSSLHPRPNSCSFRTTTPIAQLPLGRKRLDEDNFPELTRSIEAGNTVISVVEECDGKPWHFHGRRIYMVDIDGGECDVLEDKSPFALSLSGLTSPLKALLPTGWPDSVSPDYSSWVKWHILRQLFRNSYYVLGTTSLLSSLGLSTGFTLALSASLQWVLKDGLGMATKLVVSTRLAQVVDADPKRYRMVGDSLMALSAGVEILSVTHPAFFLLFGTLAALLKEAGGAMSGPSYRVFLDSFAISSNIGDVSSRGEGQVVVGNLLGLAVGATLSTLLASIDGAERLLPTVAVYFALASAHLTSMYNGVSCVQLRTLNWQRLNLIIDQYLSTATVASIRQVNRQERFIYAFSAPPSRRRLRLGAQLLDFVECGRDVSRALRNRSDRYIVAYNKQCVGIMLREDARAVDMLRAILHGRDLLRRVEEAGETGQWTREEIGNVTRASYEWTEEQFPKLVGGLQREGWYTDKVLITFGKSRYRQGRELGN